MLPFHSGAKESHGVQGQLTVTAFRWQMTFKCVYVFVQVGVNVQLIQVITIYSEAVTTQIVKWKMTPYILYEGCVCVSLWTYVLSLRPSSSVLWIRHNNSTHIAHVQSLDQMHIKNPVLLTIIHSWLLSAKSTI